MIDNIDFLPESISLFSAFIMVLASFATSAITAALGIGGGLAMLALMGLVLPVAALIPIHGIVQLGSNLGRTWRMQNHLIFSFLTPFILGAALGALIGGSIAIKLPDTILKVTLGIFIIVITWAHLPKSLNLSRRTIGIGGFITTVLTMFLGATGPLVIALLSRFFHDRKELVANTAAAMTIQHTFKTLAFGFFGFSFTSWLPLVAIMLIMGYLGTITGGHVLHTINERIFRKIFKIGISILALDMIRRGLDF